jgi:putative copper export protein
MHELLVVIHVLAAMAWVGGGLYSTVMSERALATGEGFEFVAGQAQRAGTRLFAPASAVVLLSGITIVVTTTSWRFGQTFVWASLILAAISLLIGAAFYGPTWAKVRSLQAETPDSPQLVVLRRRVLWVTRIDVVVLMSVVVLMVTKPGL